MPKYNYSYIDMETVMANPDEYINPVLHDACKNLWAKNIFTFMCNIPGDGGPTYITPSKVSAENEKIFKSLMESNPQNYWIDGYRGKTSYTLGIQKANADKMTDEEIVAKFRDLTAPLQMQDVQKTYYQTPEEFLIGCGCYREIQNPDYVDVGPMPKYKKGTDKDDYFKMMNEWCDKTTIPQTLKEFDKSKMTKSLDEYIKEKNAQSRFDPKTKNIYQSEFFLKCHRDYEKYLETQKEID